MQIQPTTKEYGFVLLEAIVAVSVLVTIFAATIALYVSSVRGLRMTNDQFIANYLAQDGMEQVIAKRQHNYTKGTTHWLEGMFDGTTDCDAGDPCAIDYFAPSKTLDDSLVTCATPCFLYTDSDGEYSHDAGGTKSYFGRTVEFAKVGGNDHEVRVTVRVHWQDGSKALQLPVTDIFYDY